jgi:hypothetical protein
MGVVTTLVNVLKVQGGNFSSTAKMTIVVTTVLSGCMLALYAVYDRVLERIKVPEDAIAA